MSNASLPPLPLLTPSAKDLAWNAFVTGYRSDPLMQGFSFSLAFAGALETSPATVRAEFDGLKVESDWAINEGRSEVRFLTQDGRIVQAMRGPLVGGGGDQW